MSSACRGDRNKGIFSTGFMNMRLYTIVYIHICRIIFPYPLLVTSKCRIAADRPHPSKRSNSLRSSEIQSDEADPLVAQAVGFRG